MKFLPCDECTVCCEGPLQATIHGTKMGPNKCCFLQKNKCTIYQIRPTVCKKYYCGYAQGLFNEDMRPDKSGYLASVENDASGQYLKIIELRENEKALQVIKEFCHTNNCKYVIIKRAGQV